MEFPNLGEHCALGTCKQLDFLPFTCDSCRRIYCKEHVTYENHNCETGLRKDRKVPVCPLCNQPVSLSPSENPDQKVNEHIENDCKSDLAKRQRSGKCSAKGCKKRELIPVQCSSCRKNFCLRHRHEADHDCIGTRLNSNNKLAVASRFQSSPQKQAPQHSQLSSIGAELNRQRNQRIPQRSQPSTLQSQSPTEDEALALALQASLASSTATTQQPAQQQPATSQSEDEDSALARAIAESEREERDRQRRLNQQTTEKDKDSCILS